MRKRLPLLLMSVALVLLGGYLTLCLTSPKHYISRENFARIQAGMSEQEVEAVLGVPAGDYANTKLAEYQSIKVIFPTNAVRLKAWTSDDGTIRVFFDAASKVCDSQFAEVTPLEGTLLGKVRRWVGL